MPSLTALFALAVAASSNAPVAPTCAQTLSVTLAAIPTLSAEAFDAAQAPGWRTLANAECFDEAAQALAAYASAHGPRYHLAFHEAQMLLFAGQDERARPRLLAALRPELPDAAPFKWNSYVRAHVAYVDGDRARFDHERAVLDAARAYAPNAMNLALLDALGRDFDGAYLASVKAMRNDE